MLDSSIKSDKSLCFISNSVKHKMKLRLKDNYHINEKINTFVLLEWSCLLSGWLWRHFSLFRIHFGRTKCIEIETDASMNQTVLAEGE